MKPEPSSSRIILPARPGFILFSFLVMFLLNLMCSGSQSWMPDWVALTLVFWSIREPRHIGMGAAFVLGALMDVADASLMGQHAMAYVLVAYASFVFSKRILWLPLKWQALQVIPLLLAVPLVQLCLRSALGADFPGAGYFVAPFIGAAFWLPLTRLLLWPQYRPVERDENRPV